MKLKLTFKSSSKKVIRKEIKIDAPTLASLLSDEALAEIAQKIYRGDYEKSGFYLCSIADND